jgi:preprotein translocase subunit SecB
MTTQGQSGINFRAIFVTKMDFEMFPLQEMGKHSVAFHLQNEFIKDTGKLESILTAKFDSQEPSAEKAFRLEVSVTGLFEEMPESALTIQQFAEVQAAALLFPYLREAVTTITSKSPVGPIILPPINVPALLKSGDPVIKGELKKS